MIEVDRATMMEYLNSCLSKKISIYTSENDIGVDGSRKIRYVDEDNKVLAAKDMPIDNGTKYYIKSNDTVENKD